MVIAGTSGDDAFVYTPSASDEASGRVSVNGVSTNFTGVEDLTLSGQSGADTLDATTAAGVPDVDSGCGG